MSVKELILGHIVSPLKIRVVKYEDKISIEFKNVDKPLGGMMLDRNQADLLRLWLEEHLK